MLVVRTYIRNNQVFTQDFIASGSLVFAFDERVDKSFTEQEFLNLNHDDLIDSYSQIWKSFTTDKYCLHGDNARYIRNYPKNPNLIVKHDFPSCIAPRVFEFYAIAARDININDELTWRHADFCKVDSEFEKLLVDTKVNIKSQFLTI